jgi:two-component system, LytTR family, sensor kinase
MSDSVPTHVPVTSRGAANTSRHAVMLASNQFGARRNLVYIGFWVGVALLLSLAAWQSYTRAGGRHLWEPFLWEASSVFAVALLMPLIYRWVNFADGSGWPKLNIGITHVLMACAFSIAHVLIMFAIRFLIYFLMDSRYEPGPVWSIMAYETPKDLVTYSLLAGICYGVVLMQREQRRELDIANIEAELSEARLTRLQNQLQPHFLFNTLNLVSALMAEDVERADTVLARLSDLLRSTLALSNRTQHSLAEELHILAPYLDIMTARFGERIKVKIDCDDAARECAIPCLLLLPLIENAVQHGVEKTTSAATIIVTGHVIADELRLSVSADVGTLERDAREGGIGLANTRNRLKQMHDGAAKISLAPLQPQGVEVLIQIPKSGQN